MLSLNFLHEFRDFTDSGRHTAVNWRLVQHCVDHDQAA
jgi:hypothetical protein